jgi:hypothetical protein
MAEILSFRRNVTKQGNEPTKGILALVSEAGNVMLVWISNQLLGTTHFKKGGQISLNICDHVNIDSISMIKLIPELSLHGEIACCLCSIVVSIDCENDWQSLLCEPIGSKIDSPSDILLLLRIWFRPYNRDLVSPDPESYCYYFTENLMFLDEKYFEQPARGSGLNALKSFGLEVVSALLGSPAAARMEHTGMEVLERFAKVTSFAKDKTTQALEHPLTRPLLPLIPENIRSQFLSSSEAEELLKDYVSAQHYFANYANNLQSTVSTNFNEIEVISMTDIEFDFENQNNGYNSHFTGIPLTAEKWQSWHDERGRLTVPAYIIACTVFCGVKL